MKDILNIMHLDYVTSRSFGLPLFVAAFVLMTLLALFIAPMSVSFTVFVALAFIIPLQSIGDKSDMHKLYGILPVARNNITRGRFAFLFTVLFLTEVLAMIVVILAMQFRLFELLPNQGTESMLMVAEAFNPDQFINYGVVVGWFTAVGIFFSYMQMMGQIFGQENEMKIIMLSLTVITVIGVGLGVLSDRDLLPVISMDKLIPDTTGEKIAVCIGCNVLVLVMHVIFGEITADKLSKREL